MDRNPKSAETRRALASCLGATSMAALAAAILLAAVQVGSLLGVPGAPSVLIPERIWVLEVEGDPAVRGSGDLRSALARQDSPVRASRIRSFPDRPGLQLVEIRESSFAKGLVIAYLRSQGFVVEGIRPLEIEPESWWRAIDLERLLVQWSFLLDVALIFLLWRRRRRRSPPARPSDVATGRTYAIVLGLVGGVILFCLVISLRGFLDLLGWSLTPAPVRAFPFATWLAPLWLVGVRPVVEERFFRGVLLDRLSAALGWSRALALGAALYVVVQPYPTSALVLFLAGLFLGGLRRFTGRVATAIAASSCYYAVVLLWLGLGLSW